MSSLDERLQNRDYANWLRVTYGLKCIKEGLCTVTGRVMLHFQENIKNQHNIAEACSNESCNSKSIKQQGVDNFKCPNNVCTIFLKSIVAEHANKKMIVWDNCDVRHWPVKCWEIAKAYMPRGHVNNTGPATTDCSGLLQLISKCKLFRSQMQMSPAAAEQVKLAVC